MKAYQVYKGGTDKNDNQHFELVNTYSNKDEAITHGGLVAESYRKHGEELVYVEYNYNKCSCWTIYDELGIPLIVADVREIDITE